MGISGKKDIHRIDSTKHEEIQGIGENRKNCTQVVQKLFSELSTSYQQFGDKLCKACE